MDGAHRLGEPVAGAMRPAVAALARSASVAVCSASASSPAGASLRRRSDAPRDRRRSGRPRLLDPAEPDAPAPEGRRRASRAGRRGRSRRTIVAPPRARRGHTAARRAARAARARSARRSRRSQKPRLGRNLLYPPVATRPAPSRPWATRSLAGTAASRRRTRPATTKAPLAVRRAGPHRLPPCCAGRAVVCALPEAPSRRRSPSAAASASRISAPGWSRTAGRAPPPAAPMPSAAEAQAARRTQAAAGIFGGSAAGRPILPVTARQVPTVRSPAALRGAFYAASCRPAPCSISARVSAMP